MTLFDELPNTWIETTLGDVSVDIRYGLTARAESDINGIFYLRISDINDYGEVKREDRKYVRQSGDLQRYILEPGDIVIARSGSVGRSYVYLGSEDPWVFASYLIRFRLNQEIVDPRYVGFYLRSPFFWRYVDSMTRTVAQPNINSQELSKLPILLPTLSEQQRIVEILYQLDELRHLRRQANELAEDAAKSIFEYMFYTHRQSWQSYKIGEVVNNIQAGKSIAAHSYPAQDNNWGVLKVSAVTYGVYRPEENKELPEDFAPIREYEVKDGDLLVSRANTAELVGASVIVKNTPPRLLLPDKLWRLHLRTELVNPYFLYGLLNTQDIRQEISLRATGTSSSMKNISQEKFLDIELLLPSIEDQNKYEEFVSVIWNDIQMRQSDSQHLFEDTISSLTSRAFNGSLTASWRARYSKVLTDDAIKRDIILGLRGKEPTMGDYEAGRVTQAEREEIERQLTESMRPMLEQLSKNFQPIGESLRVFQQNWTNQMSALIQPIRLPTVELQPIFTDVFRNTLLRQQEQFASIADSYRNMVANLSATVETSTRVYMDLANNIVNWLEEWPPTNHPRYDLVSNFNRQQKFILIICEQQEAFFTVETIQEKLGTSADAVRRNLELFASLGLIAKVSLPAQSSAGITYTPAYRYLNEDDEVRLLDLTLLEEKNPV